MALSRPLDEWEAQIAERAAKALRGTGRQQQDVASEAGMRPEQLSRCLGQTRRFRVTELAMLAWSMGVDFAGLVWGPEGPPEEPA